MTGGVHTRATGNIKIKALDYVSTVEKPGYLMV
jgi:hypothetical protein